MHKRFVALLLAAVAALGLGIGLAAPAQATHSGGICEGHWLYATWGRGCVQPPYGQTDDRLEDGYCVEAKYYDRTAGAWYHIPNSTSCGYIASWQTNDKLCIRMYRGDGRYLTLRRDASYCP